MPINNGCACHPEVGLGPSSFSHQRIQHRDIEIVLLLDMAVMAELRTQPPHVPESKPFLRTLIATKGFGFQGWYHLSKLSYLNGYAYVQSMGYVFGMLIVICEHSPAENNNIKQIQPKGSMYIAVGTRIPNYEIGTP